MKGLKLTPVLFLLLSIGSVAEELDCQGSDIRFEVSINPETRTASIILPDHSRKMSPLIVEDDRYYFYDLVPGAHDERVETRRMFRYERGPGKVFYMDHDTGIFVHGRCTTARD